MTDHLKRELWTKYELEEFEDQFKKLLANPEEELVFDHPQWHRPHVGDKVRIISWDTQTNVQECVKVSKLPYVTVKNVHPEIVGKDGITAYWSYRIEVEETHLVFLQWHYMPI